MEFFTLETSGTYASGRKNIVKNPNKVCNRYRIFTQKSFAHILCWIGRYLNLTIFGGYLVPIYHYLLKRLVSCTNRKQSPNQNTHMLREFWRGHKK